MGVEQLKKSDIEFFFNKYKNNSDQIFHLERKLLTESYDFTKWERLLTENSKLTRKLFVENEELLNQYIRPAIEHPELLSLEAIETFALHTTFYLFENNIDSLVTEELIQALLSVPEHLSKKAEFELNMNLGISKTVTCHNSLEEAVSYYEKAMSIFPDFASATDDDCRIHQIFCLTYELLAYDLYKSNDFASILKVYNKIQELISSGNPVLYGKMWSPQSDFDFHCKYVMRLMRIYVIFAVGQADFKFSPENSSENQQAKEIVCSWLRSEYDLEKSEGNINPMIFTFFQKLKMLSGEISEQQYEENIFKEYQNITERIHNQSENKQTPYIYPEMAFPDDGDPVNPQITAILDKMKLFNWSFSYVYSLLPELYKTVQDKKIRKEITQEILTYYERAQYAAKGFQTDDFIIGMVKTLAESLETIDDFMSFVQSIFVHRETTSSIHFSMVSNLMGMCLSHMIDRAPELFVTKDYPTAESVRQHRTELLQFVKNAGMLHDIGKIGITNLINLHFRRITDIEFQKIQNHTVLGGEISAGISYLEPYHDLILGHHKWHNGTCGYPKNYNQRESQYSVYIDLLSLCDCADTATDYKGRNYASKKTFDDVMAEFKADDGNRYNKALVSIIDEDEGLKEELRYMTTTGRNYTSYETYQRYIQPNTTFCEQDEKDIVLYSEEFYDAVFAFYKASYPETDDEKIRLHMNELFDSKHSLTWIITDQKKQVFGLLSGQFRTPLANNQQEYFMITDLVIKPENRRHGLGSELVSEVCQRLCSKNIHSIKIDVTNDFGLESFIWIAGFSKTKTYLMEKQI